MATTTGLPLRRTTIAEALQAMRAFGVRQASTEVTDVANAEGRILATDVSAREDVPGFARSVVDGYALIAADVRAASREKPARLRFAGEVRMGEAANISLRSGEAIKIPTGGALPTNATGVVKVEDTETSGDHILIFDGEDLEDHITAQASDLRAGVQLFARGTVLSPAAIGLIAGAGIAQITVYVPPRVAVIVTGDELVPAGQPLRPGQIRDINSVALTAALRAMGFAPYTYGRVADDRTAFAAVFDRARAECDAVVISGGSSVGERDYTPDIVSAAGSPGVIVHGVKAKPGRPALLAMIDDIPVIGLPGNPVSALVVLEALGKPILLRMFAKDDDTIPWRARLSRSLVASNDLEQRVPIRMSTSKDGASAEPLTGTSSQMHILGFADGMVVIPAGSGRWEAGTWIDVIPFSRTGTLH